MSNDNKGKKSVRGFIFYPREYHIVDGDPINSYAYGISEGGRECVVYIQPEQQHIDAAKSSTAKRIPSYEDFNESEPPCEAYRDNGPDNPRSMILMEQAEAGVNVGNSHQLPVMVAKWASVLKLNDRAITPPVGYGYLEINVLGSKSEELQHLSAEIQGLQAKIDSGIGDILSLMTKRDSLVSQLYTQAPCFFSSVLLDHARITVVTNAQELETFLAKCYEHYTRNGRFAGALVRVRDEDAVYLRDCAVYEARYDSKAGAIEDFQTSYSRFMRFGGRQALQAAQSRGITIDIIPVQRLNFGPMGNDRYQKDLAMAAESKMMKTYIENEFHCKPYINFKREKAFRYTRVALRMAKVKKGAGKGNHIVSSMHAYMSPRGNAFQIDAEARPRYRVVRT